MIAHRRKPVVTRTVLVVVATSVLATCGKSDRLTAPGASLALGTWGGDNFAVIATDSVTHVHVGCTFGDFPANIRLDGSGYLMIDGAFMLHAFPVAVGPAMPAQLSGRVIGNTLTFAIAVYDTVAKQVVSLGPGTVVLGKPWNMVVCPVCQVPGRDRLLLIKPFRGPHVDPPSQTNR
jgi:hypothetical protein